VIVLPYIGVLVYLIAEHQGMAERNTQRVQAAQQQFDQYVQGVAAQSDPAEQIARAKTLLDDGTITQAEFDQIKQKALA
jgi:membrane protease subunit (stomatin/prohibitin family)